MEDITLRQCLKGAWRDAASAVRHMPIVFLVAFVAVLATATAGYKAQFPGMEASGASLTAMTSTSAGHAAGFAQGLISLGVTFVQTLILAVLAVFVVRFAMKLNAEPAGASATSAPVLPATRLWDAGIRRYFLLCIALIAGYVGAMLAVVIVWIGLRLAGLSSGTSMAATATLAILVVCGVSYVSARLSLLFPHTAAGGRIQWRAAWEDTRGHFWFITTAAVLAILPIVGIATVLTVIAEMLATTGSIGGMTMGLMVVQSVGTVLYTATGATCSVWLYRKLAAILKAEAK
ncbi:hypothetical protein [Caballeronia sp. SBC2]|uniref:hypothetical protein n=1 Tax=Caballeronia sp. SBC2 TaxID=2705547 RepID=UPI0013E201DA|nr:hypothetical protein [Caballeronia sp. SBC2]QIE22558.1 hypothetical protein SBC2_05680 [Caballeronia sp. SBC2]